MNWASPATVRLTLTPALSLRGRGGWIALLFILTFHSAARADEIADALRKLDPVVLPAKEDKDHYRKLLPAMIEAQLKEANIKSTREWNAITNLTQWEAFRKEKLAALRKGIGEFPANRCDLKPQVTRTLTGEGFTVDCLAFESRPGFLVTANLYVPDPLPASAPAIIIHPSHHNPKTQSELQDMGMTWARAGCYVLVMDQIGHGERRAHPFASDADYPKPFRAGRQDYWFRYNTGMQLHLIGDSLIGWQAYDLSRGVDYVLTRKNVDAKRIAMMGSVAGGGDPVAVAAALDERVACAVVFNFGGPQPETKYPLPEDAEEKFNYAGSGSWESTRNVSFSARDGFLPWVIVGSIAPRKLIYAHEFSWDQERDPVWKRLKRIYAWHGKPEHLASTHGYGSVRESGDKASHCNNIGAVHRKAIHASLVKWFGIAEPKEYSKRLPSSELLALTPELIAERKPLPLAEAALVARVGTGDAQAPPAYLHGPPATGQTIAHWLNPLGGVEVLKPAEAKTITGKTRGIAGAAAHPFAMVIDDGIVVPCWLFVPPKKGDRLPAVVVMVSQQGKAALIKDRADGIAALLNAGIAVCLPDVRGTGETRLDESRGRNSWDTAVSSSALMLGKPLLGQRLRDVRAVVAYLKTRDDVDAQSLGFWGDSLSPVSAADFNFRVPHDTERVPLCEPLGARLALLAGALEDHTKAVYARGGVFAMGSALANPFLSIPHDMVVPGAVGPNAYLNDDADAALRLALAGRGVRMAGMVNANNQGAQAAAQHRVNVLVRLIDPAAKAKPEVQVDATPSKDDAVAAWFVEKLK